MILLAYDGSPDAQAAIDHAAHVLAGTQATVLTIWEPFREAVAHSAVMSAGVGFGGPYSSDDDVVDRASAQTALETATEGVQRATAAGLVAQLRVVSRHGGIAQAILAVATEVDAGVIVLGTRGRGGVKAFLLGSVSHAVTLHADRPVLVVPSPTVADARREEARIAAVGV